VRQRHVRPSAEVGDVDDGPTTWLEHPVRLREHRLEQFEVLLEGGVRVVVLPNVVRRRSDHQDDAVVRQLRHPLRRVLEDLVGDLRRGRTAILGLRNGDERPLIEG